MQPDNIDENLDFNIDYIRQQMGSCTDLSVQHLKLFRTVSDISISIIFLSSLADKTKVENIIEELNKISKNMKIRLKSSTEFVFQLLQYTPMCGCEVIAGSEFKELFQKLLSGYTLILIDGYSNYLAYKTYGPEGRSLEEPTSQSVIRGPKEGFTEKIEVNISLIRRRIKDTSLRIEGLNVGSVTKTNVALMYINGIARDEIVNEIRTRINKINIDGILESRYIEELIKDNPYTIFPTINDTERPDAVSSALLDGHVAIFVDGTPFALILPATFMEFFISSEDYYHHFIIATIFRITRLIAFFLTMLVPALYIALTSYSPEFLPTPLLLNLAAQREGVPLPVVFEAFLMELTFEILREAGVRMPRAIGPAISIVGALVLGQAAVQAGIVSAAMVIVVSITAITNFCIPNIAMANGLRTIRFAFMILAAIMGFYGVLIGLMGMTLHLCNLKIIGVPYMSPIAPKLTKKYEDTFVRIPFWKRKLRPGFISSSTDLRADMEGINVNRGNRRTEMK